MDSSETHIVLLGDSIFDNGRYTSGGPDVIAQVCQLLPKGLARVIAGRRWRRN